MIQAEALPHEQPAKAAIAKAAAHRSQFPQALPQRFVVWPPGLIAQN